MWRRSTREKEREIEEKLDEGESLEFRAKKMNNREEYEYSMSLIKSEVWIAMTMFTSIYREVNTKKKKLTRIGK